VKNREDSLDDVMSSSKVVGIVAKNSIDFVRHALKSLAAENIVVNLRSHDDQERIAELGITKVYEPELETGWAKGFEYPATQTAALAQVLFSSGTEGKPKAILLSQKALSNTTDRLLSVMEIDSSIREYVGVPVHYSFGFGRCRTVARAGGEFYIPPNGFNPIEIAELLGNKAINAISAVPTLWRVLLQAPDLFDGIGQYLRWIEIGSQYMSRDEKEQLKKLFPKAIIVQHYGLTEASRSTFLKIHQTQGAELESVGKCYDGVEVAINDSGRITIRGEHVSSGIVKEQMLVPLTDENGWFETSDSGEFKGDYLYYKGRVDDVINCGGIKLSPDLLEQKLNDALGSAKAIAIAKIADEFRGEVPVIAYLADAGMSSEQIKKVAESTLADLGVNVGSGLILFACESFPTTDTGKIQRRKITQVYQSAQKVSAKKVVSSQTNTSQSPSVNAIVEIWEETLKISPIDIHSNFFDLGGDSISAMAVAVKMQKVGIPQEACQKIFQGASIIELSGDSDEPLLQQVTDIWEDVLKLPEIDIDRSFFDLGGDSLSAIRVATKMEKAGIPKQLCQEIFAGLTLREVVAKHSQAKGNTTQKHKITPLACASRALNIVRGLLIMVNILAHWAPGIVARMPQVFTDYNRYLAVFYSSGTPGFAVVFGAGVGFFFLPRYLANPGSLTALMLRNALILGVGITCLMLLRITSRWLSGMLIDALLISNSFWVVLIYYFYALLTVPLWFKIITHFKNHGLACIVLALFSYSAHLVIVAINIPASTNPVVQHLILLFTSQYNYFEMTAGALLGTAFGIWIKESISRGASLSIFLWVGLALIGFSLVIASEMNELSLFVVWPKIPSLWSWPLYLGMVLVMICGAYYIVETVTHGWSLRLVNTISTIGVLAFPLFLTHQMVIPLKNVLYNIGIPLALPISILLYAGLSIYLISRVNKVYFGSSLAKL